MFSQGTQDSSFLQRISPSPTQPWWTPPPPQNGSTPMSVSAVELPSRSQTGNTTAATAVKFSTTSVHPSRFRFPILVSLSPSEFATVATQNFRARVNGCAYTLSIFLVIHTEPVQRQGPSAFRKHVQRPKQQRTRPLRRGAPTRDSTLPPGGWRVLCIHQTSWLCPLPTPAVF